MILEFNGTSYLLADTLRVWRGKESGRSMLNEGNVTKPFDNSVIMQVTITNCCGVVMG